MNRRSWLQFYRHRSRLQDEPIVWQRPQWTSNRAKLPTCKTTGGAKKNRYVILGLVGIIYYRVNYQSWRDETQKRLHNGLFNRFPLVNCLIINWPIKFRMKREFLVIQINYLIWAWRASCPFHRWVQPSFWVGDTQTLGYRENPGLLNVCSLTISGNRFHGNRRLYSKLMWTNRRPTELGLYPLVHPFLHYCKGNKQKEMIN